MTSTELGYLDGVSASIQSQLDNKAPKASPTFTGTVTAPELAAAGTWLAKTTANGSTRQRNVAIGDSDTGIDWISDGILKFYANSTEVFEFKNSGIFMNDGKQIEFNQYGTNYIKDGNGDAASYTSHNIRIHGHYGMGMEAYDGTINGFYDFRAGKWDVKDGYYVNGKKVYHEGNQPLVTGRYTGDATAGRTISLPFTPSHIILTGKEGEYFYSAQSGSDAYESLSEGQSGAQIALQIVTNGFKVWYNGGLTYGYSRSNTANQIYHYVAFK